ncbi:hypothetical protein VULLAG_LOCUS4605 [Vulpes lagopus]
MRSGRPAPSGDWFGRSCDRTAAQEPKWRDKLKGLASWRPHLPGVVEVCRCCRGAEVGCVSVSSTGNLKVCPGGHRLILVDNAVKPKHTWISV